MVQLKDIEKIIFYSQICEECTIKRELNMKKDKLIIKKMRNNFGRFWNEINKKQKNKWIKLSTEKEINRIDIDKIIRYADEVEMKIFMKDYLNEEEDYYNDEYKEINEDDKNETYNLKHNILIFWIGQTKEKKKRLIKIINEYWEKNEYKEYERNKRKYKKEEYKDEEIMREYDKKRINNKIKYLVCKSAKNLDNLPNKLEVLICENNDIKSLKRLPKSLKALYCGDNPIEELILPKGLIYLDCQNTKIEKLKLSPYLEGLCCDDGYINYENLPNMLIKIIFGEKEKIIKHRLPYGIEEVNDHNGFRLSKDECVMLPESVKIIR
jgi:hypothetical protein